MIGAREAPQAARIVCTVSTIFSAAITDSSVGCAKSPCEALRPDTAPGRFCERGWPSDRSLPKAILDLSEIATPVGRQQSLLQAEIETSERPFADLSDTSRH
jgi:hypothetical protein